MFIANILHNAMAQSFV